MTKVYSEGVNKCVPLCRKEVRKRNGLMGDALRPNKIEIEHGKFKEERMKPTEKDINILEKNIQE